MGTCGNKGKHEHLKQQSREQPQAVTGHHHKDNKDCEDCDKDCKECDIV